MIDPLVSLAYNLYSSKGTYALLLGSGASRASGIPTGWEVVLDLIRNVAKIEGADCGPNPEVWLKDKHGLDPDYSSLLDLLAKTPAERQQLLSAYFEPTEEQRKEGLKIPTLAHRAIAWLAAHGYVRVIITTNFDRLIERAIEEAGITPTVISTIDHLKGARPLVHSQVSIIKVHGDYLDSRIRNTVSELAGYEPELNTLLDRVFDEYGLIVCGWSAIWDGALRAAIERCPSRRYTMYWASHGDPDSVAKALIEKRGGVTITIGDANTFFGDVREKVESMASISAQHPLSAKVAVAAVKRYIVDLSARIRLRDLVHEETERLAQALTIGSFPAAATQDPAKELLSRLQKYDALCETLVDVLATGAYWGDQQQAKLWANSVRRIGNLPHDQGGLVYLVKLRRYPALILFYAAGIAAVAAGNNTTVAELLKTISVNENGSDVPVAAVLNTLALMERDIGRLLPGMERHKTPSSDWVFNRLRAPLREFLATEDDYSEAFNRWEYYLGLFVAEWKKDEWQQGWWGPIGRFVWKWESDPKRWIPAAIKAEIDAHGNEWPPLKAGLFGIAKEPAGVAIEKFNKHVGLVASQMQFG